MTYGCTDIGFAPYGDYWGQRRKICTLELLSQKQVQSFRSLGDEEFLNLARWIALNQGSLINLTKKMYSSTYGLTSRVAFGMKTKEQETFVSLVQETVSLASGFDLADLYPYIKFLQVISGIGSKLRRLHQQSDRILENIIDEHKLKRLSKFDDSQHKEDLVDVLLKFQEDGAELPLTTDNIKAVILDVFIAGSDNYVTTVDWAMAEMLRNPRILKKAQAEVRQAFNGKRYVDETLFHELKYLKLVINETLRLHPPLPLLLPRECIQRCKIDGYDIPTRARIMVNVWSTGRDPKLWDDPESFIPERFLDSSVDFKENNFEYIPFGAGRRICPGLAFGLANVELPLATFLYHFDWDLPSEVVMTESYGSIVKRKVDLMVIPIVSIDAGNCHPHNC